MARRELLSALARLAMFWLLVLGTVSVPAAQTPSIPNIIVQGSFKGDTTARAADALAEGVQAACSRYALRRLQTTQSRLDRELKEQADLSRRLDLAQSLLDKVQGDSGLSATNRLLAATVAGNTLSNIVQRQNVLGQSIGDDQSLLQQVKYVELGGR